MQTFLPYESFTKSASVLDRQRLGKQRVENLQVIKALITPGYGWQNHPAVKMWRGHEYTLLKYQEAICNEWTGRGYKDTCLEKSIDLLAGYPIGITKPKWLGNVEFHESHQSNLLRKFPEHYSQYFTNVSDNLEYVWPIGA
jgi:hypothetical protein